MKRSRLKTLVMLVVGLTVALTAGSAGAVAFTVNTTADTHDRTPGNSSCADTSRFPRCSLRAAIEEANALNGNITITLPAGTYRLNPAFGQLTVTAPITLNGAGSGTTIIDGQGQTRVMEVDVISIILSSVTLQNGNGCPSSAGCGTSRPGGDLLVGANGWVTARHDLFTVSSPLDSPAFPGGGGDVRGVLDLTNSTFANNSTPSDAFGGQMFSGGGLFIEQAGSAIVDYSTFSGNAATRGGGIGVGGGNITLRNSTVSSNTSQVEAGAGLWVSGNGLNRVMYTTIVRNTILSPSQDPAVLNIWGAGIAMYLGNLSLGKCIIAENVDPRGQFSPHFSPDIGQDSSSSIVSYDDNLIGVVGEHLGNYVGADGNPWDWFGNAFVQLGPLGNNGGETFTHELQDGDPIDSYSGDGGDVAFAAPGDDQTHFPRPRDGNGDGVALADSGSYEF